MLPARWAGPAGQARSLAGQFGSGILLGAQNDLRRALWLGKWELPSAIPYAACNVTKARRLAHTGKLRTEKERGATWHLATFTSDQLSIDNCKCAAVFRDEASALKIAIPIAQKSDLEAAAVRMGVMRQLRLPPIGYLRGIAGL